MPPNRPFMIGLLLSHFEQPWNGATIGWKEIEAVATTPVCEFPVLKSTSDSQ